MNLTPHANPFLNTKSVGDAATYSLPVLPVFFLLPLFGTVPGFVRLFLLVVLLFALGQDCAVVRMVLRVERRENRGLTPHRMRATALTAARCHFISMPH